MNVSSLSPWFQTSIQFGFLPVLVVFCFLIVVVLLLVVQGDTVCLPTPPSWLEVVFIHLEFIFVYGVS